MCSKKEIYDLIPSRWIPKTLKFNHKDSVEKISTAIDQFQMSFPLVLKPDIGLKGLGVHFIENYSQLEKEVKNLDSDYLIQEKIDSMIEQEFMNQKSMIDFDLRTIHISLVVMCP